uniref:Uncharacterized protein n=1 Tax=Lepeophtheirus salmonis TaxID=72036 RepID=A0A0K2UP57_LEPSM
MTWTHKGPGTLGIGVRKSMWYTRLEICVPWYGRCIACMERGRFVGECIKHKKAAKMSSDKISSWRNYQLK